MSIVWFALLAVAFFVFIVLPQRRKMAAFAEMQNRLVEGDEVILTSGIYATVVALADEQVDVQIAPEVVIRVARVAIGQVRALRDADEVIDIVDSAERDSAPLPDNTDEAEKRAGA
jgi:preprotein translocase subunit YajC